MGSFFMYTFLLPFVLTVISIQLKTIKFVPSGSNCFLPIESIVTLRFFLILEHRNYYGYPAEENSFQINSVVTRKLSNIIIFFYLGIKLKILSQFTQKQWDKL